MPRLSANARATRRTMTSGTPMPSATQRYRHQIGSCRRAGGLLRFGGGRTGVFGAGRGAAYPLVGAASLRALLNIAWKRFFAAGDLAAGGVTMIVGADANVDVSSLPDAPTVWLAAVLPTSVPPTAVAPTEVGPSPPTAVEPDPIAVPIAVPPTEVSPGVKVGCPAVADCVGDGAPR